MPKLITPKTSIKVVPKEGEIEITLNINISVDGQIANSSENIDVNLEEDESHHILPEFESGFKLNFGKSN